MTSKSSEVRQLLKSLAIAIDRSPHNITAQAMGNAFYGNCLHVIFYFLKMHFDR